MHSFSSGTCSGLGQFTARLSGPYGASEPAVNAKIRPNTDTTHSLENKEISGICLVRLQVVNEGTMRMINLIFKRHSNKKWTFNSFICNNS